MNSYVVRVYFRGQCLFVTFIEAVDLPDAMRVALGSWDLSHADQIDIKERT